MSSTIYNQMGSQPHIALFPTSGMGHITPFLRLAAMLASRNCTVTVITAQPTVSAAESTHFASFFATHPHIKRLDFQILPYTPSDATTADPFFVQFEAISHSTHLLLPPLSALSPPLSAIFSDFPVATAVNHIADDLGIPNYVVSTTSPRMFSLMVYRPFLFSESSTKISNSTDNQVQIPGTAPLPISSIPPPFFSPDHLFSTVLDKNAPSILKAKGVLFNTFDWFDSETIIAFATGKVITNFPRILPVGPFEPCHRELEQGNRLSWLDDQPAQSVVYVSFGSRTALSKDQIRELRNGLERSGHTFLWVLKGSKVDKDDKEELEELLGISFLERTKYKGMVVKGWVNQEEILAHPSIGGFVSHCGWNSVMEVARRGIPVLAWPQHGDQKINAELVEKAGLGLWVRHWGWGGERLVLEEEIGNKVKEVMEDESLRVKARKVGEEARKAKEACGSSEKVLMGVVESLKPK